MDGEEDLKALCSLVINNFYGASIKSHDRNLSLIRATLNSFLPSFHSLSLSGFGHIVGVSWVPFSLVVVVRVYFLCILIWILFF